MALLPRSRTARRRLMTFAVAAPVLALAAGVALYAARGSISYFYTPSQAADQGVRAGQPIRLGGMVRPGSVIKKPDGEVDFVIADKHGASPVRFKGELPDLFREGQGVIATGTYDASGVFVANSPDGILAKHDEKYMPAELKQALQKEGELHRGEAPAEAAQAQPARTP